MSKARALLVKTEGSLVRDVKASDAVRRGIEIAIQRGIKLKKRNILRFL